jgi:hypothetical protein
VLVIGYMWKDSKCFWPGQCKVPMNLSAWPGVTTGSAPSLMHEARAGSRNAHRTFPRVCTASCARSTHKESERAPRFFPVCAPRFHPAADWEEVLNLWEKMGFASIDDASAAASGGAWSTTLYVTIPYAPTPAGPRNLLAQPLTPSGSPRCTCLGEWACVCVAPRSHPRSRPRCHDPPPPPSPPLIPEP